jgi:hypothetical protein
LTSNSTIRSLRKSISPGKVEKWARGVFVPEEGVDIKGGAVVINLLNLELLIIHLQVFMKTKNLFD